MENKEHIVHGDVPVSVGITEAMLLENGHCSSRKPSGNRGIRNTEDTVQIEVAGKSRIPSCNERRLLRISLIIDHGHKERVGSAIHGGGSLHRNSAKKQRLLHISSCRCSHRTGRLRDERTIERKIIGIGECSVEELNKDSLQARDLLVVPDERLKLRRKSRSNKTRAIRALAMQRKNRKLIFKRAYRS